MRNLAILMLLIAFGTKSQSQMLKGRYQETGPSLDVGKKQLVFSGNSFTFSIHGHMTNKIGEGKFAIKDSLLILNFSKPAHVDTSRYLLEGESINVNIADIDVRVNDENSRALKAWVGIRDKSDQPIALFLTDDKGYAQIVLSKNNSIGYFTIRLMGYETISIPFGKLLGRNSTITAYLKPQTSSVIEAHREVYRIIKLADGELILSGDDGILKMAMVPDNEN